MNKPTKRSRAAILGTASAITFAMLATPALAEAAAEEGNTGGLKEIIVQARKVDENLQTVPVAVTVLSGDDLVKRSVIRFQDVASFTPGLYMRSAANSPSGIAVSMRGQFQSDNLVTLDPSVGTYVDGVNWARAYGLNSTMLDVSSVQVLKGPQGTLFGRNTTGGAILINTNDPKLGEFSGKISVAYGRYNEFQPTVVLNAPLGEKVAIRLAGTRLSRDGYTTNSVPSTAATAVTSVTAAVAQPPVTGNLNGIKLDNRDRWQGRAKLLFQMTDTFKVVLSAEYFHMDEVSPSRVHTYNVGSYTAANSTFSTGATSALYAGILNGGSATTPATTIPLGLSVLSAEAARLAANPDIAAQNEIPYVFAKTQTYNATGSLDTGWGEIKLIGSWRKIDSYAGFDLDGTALPIHFTESQQSVKQQSAELQITGKAFDKAVDFAVGAFAFHESGFDQSISIIAPLINPVTSHFYGMIDNDSLGLYSQATWYVNDQIGITGGLRYSVDDKGLDSRNNNFNRSSSTTICSLVAVPNVIGTEKVSAPQCSYKLNRASFSGWSYVLGIDWKPAEDIMVYAKTSKGFRSGGWNLRATTVATAIPFQPEVAYSHEIGFKGEFLDNRLRFNLAAYTTRINGLQRSTIIATAPIPPSTTPGTATILGNAGKARFNGIEAELTARVAEGLTLSATGSLTDPKYISYFDSALGPVTGDRSFERFNGVPKEQFTLGADYSMPAFGNGEVNFHVDYAWRGETPLDPYYYAANPENAAIVKNTTAPALGLVNARASVKYNNFEIAVYGRNLTNERKYVQNQQVVAVGYISATYSEPRTFGVEASYSF